MPTAFDQEKKDFSITVPVGQTSAVIKGIRIAQNARTIIVKPPSPTAQYRVQIDYSDAFPCRRFPDSGNARGVMIKDMDALIVGVFSVYVTDAEPGEYKIRLVGTKIRT